MSLSKIYYVYVPESDQGGIYNYNKNRISSISAPNHNKLEKIGFRIENVGEIEDTYRWTGSRMGQMDTRRLKLNGINGLQLTLNIGHHVWLCGVPVVRKLGLVVNKEELEKSRWIYEHDNII